ncbi:MAG: hypothetical protein R3B48_19725 [Kofleriaceae bacterium]
MRRGAYAAWVLALSLSACAGGGRGPAWPKSAGTLRSEDWKEDGGEPVSPRASVLSSVERSDEPERETTSEAPAASVDVAPDASEPTAPISAEEPIELDDLDLGEGIVIEIED